MIERWRTPSIVVNLRVGYRWKVRGWWWCWWGAAVRYVRCEDNTPHRTARAAALISSPLTKVNTWPVFIFIRGLCPLSLRQTLLSIAPCARYFSPFYKISNHSFLKQRLQCFTKFTKWKISFHSEPTQFKINFFLFCLYYVWFFLLSYLDHIIEKGMKILIINSHFLPKVNFFFKSCTAISFGRTAGLIQRHDLKIGLRVGNYYTHYNERFNIKHWASVQGSRQGSVRRKPFLAPLLSNSAQHQLTDRFKNMLYQNLQVSVLCTSSSILKIFPQRGIEFKSLIFA